MTALNLNAMTQEQLIALVQQMQQQPAKKITLKVSDKGGLSMYGLGRFPVTLYRSQWERLLSEADTIRAFIAANDKLLAVKA